MKLIEEKYKNHSIFCYENRFIEIAKKIVDKKIKVLKALKDTKRNYVAIVEENKEKFVLKEPRNEFRIPQRKFFTLFKKGEALNTLINVTKMIDEYNIKEYVRPYLAIVKREKGMIVYSSLLMEFSEGKIETSKDKLDEIIKKMIEIHNLGFYHGDFNPSNFLFENNKLRILDTQAKKRGLSTYRLNYDIITMQMDSYSDMEYPYKKNFGYWFALSVKKLKRLKFVEAIKKKKKELRDKGWKI